MSRKDLGFCGIGFCLFLGLAMSCGPGSESANQASSENDSGFGMAASAQGSGVNTKISKTGRPASPSNSTRATFKFSCTAAPCTFKCKLDSKAWTTCVSPKKYSGLAGGDHTFKVKAASSSGQSDRTPASYSWHIEDAWAATSTKHAPAGRSNLTAVWTGTKAIFWGGDYYDGVDEHYLNTGGVYDPATDSWAATATNNAPAGRYIHTAVWADTQMIVWGGYISTGTTNTGGKYNPGTNSWVALETANAPTARYGQTAVWTGSEMIVWGGYSGGYINTGARYDGNSWTPNPTSNAPTARGYHTAVWASGLATPVMIVWGGIGTGSVYFNDGGRYDPSGNSWSATSGVNAPGIRDQHTAVWTGSKMIIWGGSYNDGAWHYLNTGGIYDPVGDSWTATAISNAPAGRNGHVAVWTAGAPVPVMIVWGGNDLNTGGRYDLGADSWAATQTINAPSGRSATSAVWADTHMIIWGDSNYSTIGGRYWP